MHMGIGVNDFELFPHRFGSLQLNMDRRYSIFTDGVKLAMALWLIAYGI